MLMSVPEKEGSRRPLVPGRRERRTLGSKGETRRQMVASSFSFCNLPLFDLQDWVRSSLPHRAFFDLPFLFPGSGSYCFCASLSQHPAGLRTGCSWSVPLL